MLRRSGRHGAVLYRPRFLYRSSYRSRWHARLKSYWRFSAVFTCVSCNIRRDLALQGAHGWWDSHHCAHDTIPFVEIVRSLGCNFDGYSLQRTIYSIDAASPKLKGRQFEQCSLASTCTRSRYSSRIDAGHPQHCWIWDSQENAA